MMVAALLKVMLPYATKFGLPSSTSADVVALTRAMTVIDPFNGPATRPTEGQSLFLPTGRGCYRSPADSVGRAGPPSGDSLTTRSAPQFEGGRERPTAGPGNSFHVPRSSSPVLHSRVNNEHTLRDRVSGTPRLLHPEGAAKGMPMRTSGTSSSLPHLSDKNDGDPIPSYRRPSQKSLGYQSTSRSSSSPSSGKGNSQRQQPDSRDHQQHITLQTARTSSNSPLRRATKPHEDGEDNACNVNRCD